MSRDHLGEGESLFSFAQRFPGILLLTGIFLLNLLARYIWSPLLVEIETDFSLRHTQAGALFLLITIGYFIGMALSGHLSARSNHQKTVIYSCYSCGLAMIGAVAAPNLIYLMAALFCIGFTSGLYLPTGIALLTYRLAERDFGKAFGIHEMAPSLGFICGPLLAEAFLGWSWRYALIPVAIGLLLIGWAYQRRSWSGDFRGEAISLRNLRLVASKPAFWWMSIPFIFGVGANVGVFAILPLYLQVERGLDQSVTNFMLSGSRVGALLSVLLSGWAVYRYSARTVVILIFAAAGLFTALLGLLPTAYLWVPIFLQPLFATAFFPPAYAILAHIVRPQYRNLVTALIGPVAMVVGGGFIPTLISAFGDAGRFHTGFTLMGFVAMASTGFLVMVCVEDPGTQG